MAIPSPESLKRVRADSLEVRKERAFEDFVQMGPRRSIDALYGQYKEMAREFGRHAVPTLHRNDLYEWAKADNWRQRAIERDQRVIASQRRDYDSTRRLRLDALWNMSALAEQALRELLESDETRDSVKLQAAREIYDRIGITAKTAPPPVIEELPELPEEDASDAEFEEVYQKLRRGMLNA